ncbi:MAG: hypothetical protein P8P74_06860 [Crocinitomicaceae bacterium]|nr:hypothetical protein [Crocinitomicaceae bacterium]
MDNGWTIIIAMSLMVMAGIVIQYALFQNRKKQKTEYPNLWKKFENYKELNSYPELLTVGNELIFNKHLT